MEAEDRPAHRPAPGKQWRRQTPARLSSDLPPVALDDAFRKLTRVDAPSFVERNRALHWMLIDDITVEYRRKHGSIAGAQVRRAG